jgi:hypothetical protein
MTKTAVGSFTLDETNGVWEWNESRTQWRQYNHDIQKILNESHNAKEEKVKLLFSI